jgi:hypothetical protein
MLLVFLVVGIQSAMVDPLHATCVLELGWGSAQVDLLHVTRAPGSWDSKYGMLLVRWSWGRSRAQVDLLHVTCVIVGIQSAQVDPWHVLGIQSAQVDPLHVTCVLELGAVRVDLLHVICVPGCWDSKCAGGPIACYLCSGVGV